MGYSTTSTGLVGVTDVSKEHATLKSEVINGTFVNVFQTADVSTTVYRGLSRSDAESVCTRSYSSTLGGTTRTYLGGIKVTVANGGASTWFSVFGCWGTEVTSRMAQDGDSHLFNVTVTTKVLNVTVPSATGVTTQLL